MTTADSELAAEYGVSPAIIETFRVEKCTRDVHWTQTGGRIVWLPAGLDLLPALLGLEKNGGGAESVMLTILRIFPNPIWVMVATPDGGTATVRVRYNKNLHVRMQITCQPQAGGEWRCVHSGIAPG
mgnify:CR=1 FL=1